jgi:hypothetical protein
MNFRVLIYLRGLTFQLLRIFLLGISGRSPEGCLTPDIELFSYERRQAGYLQQLLKREFFVKKMLINSLDIQLKSGIPLLIITLTLMFLNTGLDISSLMM